MGAVKSVEVEPAKVEVATKLVSAPVVAAPVVAAAPAAYTYHHAYAGAPVAYSGYGYPYAGVYGAYPYAHAYHGLAAAPSDPTNPHLVHTSRFGICTNYLGAQVSC